MALLHVAAVHVLEARAAVAAVWLVHAVKVAVRAGGRALRYEGLRGCARTRREHRAAASRGKSRHARERHLTGAPQEGPPVDIASQILGNYSSCLFQH